MLSTLTPMNRFSTTKVVLTFDPAPTPNGDIALVLCYR
jgi:hypothetical protein